MSASASPSIATPSDNFDVQIFDEHGLDVLQGLVIDCDANGTTSAAIVYDSTSVHPAVNEQSSLRIRIGQQFAASAEMTITLYFALGY